MLEEVDLEQQQAISTFTNILKTFHSLWLAYVNLWYFGGQHNALKITNSPPSVKWLHSYIPTVLDSSYKVKVSQLGDSTVILLYALCIDFWSVSPSWGLKRTKTSWWEIYEFNLKAETKLNDSVSQEINAIYISGFLPSRASGLHDKDRKYWEENKVL